MHRANITSYTQTKEDEKEEKRDGKTTTTKTRERGGKKE